MPEGKDTGKREIVAIELLYIFSEPFALIVFVRNCKFPSRVYYSLISSNDYFTKSDF